MLLHVLLLLVGEVADVVAHCSGLFLQRLNLEKNQEKQKKG